MMECCKCYNKIEDKDTVMMMGEFGFDWVCIKCYRELQKEHPELPEPHK
jgi:uncharacterized phage-like protein YoqJ